VGTSNSVKVAHLPQKITLMAEVKRSRFSVDWYVISAQLVRRLVVGIVMLAAFAGAGYWAYTSLKNNAAVVTPIGNQSAKFIDISGEVLVKREAATDFVKANESMSLEAGDTIQTMSNSVARVQFVDGASYTIKPDTTLVIKDNELMADKSTKVKVNVRVGTINLATVEQTPGSTNVVQTEAASAKVGSNSSATVATGEKGDQVDVKIERGDAEVLTQSGEVFQARVNERLEVEKSGKAIKTSLLQIPSLQSPENQQTLRLEGKGSVKFNWSAIAQATNYAIEIATSATFGATVLNTRDGLRVPTATFDNLHVGSYYWRVRADKGAEQGSFSDANKFAIVGKNGKNHEINIEILNRSPMGGSSYVLEGHCDVGARVKVGGAFAKVDSQGNFKAFVTLSSGSREVLVEAEDQDGNTGRKLVRF
jgi:hypothetical protein